MNWHPIILAPYKILPTLGRSNSLYQGICLTVKIFSQLKCKGFLSIIYTQI